jgi:hypothetical protein
MLGGWSRRSEDKDDAAIECDLSRAIVIVAILYEYAEVGWTQQKIVGLCEEGDKEGSAWFAELQAASVGRRCLDADEREREE